VKLVHLVGFITKVRADVSI